jgi:phosphatidylserine/phosphatidylglycerophosphate/cardiolipin synthase-like enzyme
VLGAAGKGSLVYIENQYFFDHGIISEIYEAAKRDAKIIVILTSKPDEGTLQGEGESVFEKVENVLGEVPHYKEVFQLVAGHSNVALLTLGNSRPDPRTTGKIIDSETYIHSKNMAVFGDNWAVMTGGSANIAFTSMWFHSEMNIAFMDTALIKNWVAQLWSEHLQVSVEQARELLGKPDGALTFFKAQATRNLVALKNGQMPEGRVYDWDTEFPARKLDGIDLSSLPTGGGG